MFEKAHTPTDDELRDAIDHIQGAVEFQDAINPEAVRVVISAARRSEVPEPSAEALPAFRVNPKAPIPYVGTTDEFMVNVQPQGEPSDAQVMAAMDAFYGEHDAVIAHPFRENMRAALRAASAVTEQGENR